MLTLNTSCNDWLDVQPNDKQITVEFWQSKEDVESVVMSGYRYMRDCVPTLLKWGELRGGTLQWASSGSVEGKLQSFNMLPSNSMCSYSTFFQVINAANSVLKYAPDVTAIDNTYHESMMKAHLTEAYFMRAYMNLILLKNYKEFPLVLQPYVDDSAPFDIAKSTEEEIVAQIKADVIAALETGAAKGTYEVDWETKGRATKWALYALMADVCLWSEDYETCKDYCDKILNAPDNFRPVFIADGSQWYRIFSDGNSNESIFELNWDKTSTEQSNNNFTSLFPQSNGSNFQFTTAGGRRVQDEYDAVFGTQLPERIGRMWQTSVSPVANYKDGKYYVYKYLCQDNTEVPRPLTDANFIIYRVSEILLMKAQAEVMLGNIPDAIRLVNRIRVRAGLGNYDGIDDDDTGAMSSIDEQSILEEILLQKDMEFIAEGKKWYDLVWFGKISNFKYKDAFIQRVIEGNENTSDSWIASVLIEPYAWYLPLPQSDIEHNRLLVQNPYYETSK